MRRPSLNLFTTFSTYHRFGANFGKYPFNKSLIQQHINKTEVDLTGLPNRQEPELEKIRF